jgi:hypothetical protein
MALLYPVSLFFSVDDWDVGLRWFQNTPVFSVFLFSAFPISVLLLLEVSSDFNQRLTSRPRRFEVAILGFVLSAFTIAIVADGFPRDPIAPHLLWDQTAEEADRIENLLRSAQFDQSESGNAARTDLSERYREMVGGFGSVRQVLTRGSPAAWAMFVVSVVGALVVPWLFTIVFALVRNKQLGTARHVDLILLAFVLLLTFVPFRAYSDWYRDSVYGSDVFKTMTGFLILGIFAMAIVGALLIQRRSTTTKLAFGLLWNVVAGAMAVAGLETWGWLRYIANAPPLQVFAAYVLFAVVTVLYSVSVREGALSTLPRD